MRVVRCKLLTLRYGVQVSPGGRRILSTELGKELRRLRTAAGRTVTEVAGALGWAESSLSRKEMGKTAVSKDDLGRLLAYYAADPATLARIHRLAQSVDQHPARRGAQRTKSEAIPDEYEQFVRLEERASRLSSYNAMVVPSLLQLPEYASAIIGSTPVPEDDFVQVRVQTRMVRQAVLGRVPPPVLRVILDESVLLRRIGDRHTMRRQMLRLVEVGESPSTTIQVLSLDSGAHPALSGTFAVLEFEDGELPRVFCDDLTGGTLRDRDEDVQRYSSCFEMLRELALDPQQSLDLIQRAADNYNQ